MTGLYVLTNLLGARTGDPTPDQIAAHCRSFREGASGLDKPAWSENDYYERAGRPMIRTNDGSRPAEKEVEILIYGEAGPGRIAAINTKPPESVWCEADFRRACQESQGIGSRERTTAWISNFYMGE